jgi:hypothetical protein
MATGAKSIKKLAKLGEGTAVFLTQEIGKLGWKQGEYVSVEVIEEKEGEIRLRRVKL